MGFLETGRMQLRNLKEFAPGFLEEKPRRESPEHLTNNLDERTPLAPTEK
jgi:hypothetical protein